jgi:protein-disulfide isomerase
MAVANPRGMSRLKTSVNASDHSVGSSIAPVTLVEYGDFECLYCRQAYSVVEELKKEFGSALRFVFRQFPLSDLHPHASLAAEASEAAAYQGKFWEMYHLLYENADALEFEDLIEYAEKIGLNMKQFMEDLDDGVFSEKISEDVQGALRSGVRGTPTFFLNGVRYDEAWDFETISELISEILTSHDGIAFAG